MDVRDLVRVKPLIWQDDEWRQEKGSVESARSEFGRYYVKHGAMYWGPGVIVASGYADLAAAKAAAQLDYDSRVLAALTPASDGRDAGLREAARKVADVWGDLQAFDGDKRGHYAALEAAVENMTTAAIRAFAPLPPAPAQEGEG